MTACSVLGVSLDAAASRGRAPASYSISQHSLEQHVYARASGAGMAPDLEASMALLLKA
jgi:hypothetical protein